MLLIVILALAVRFRHFLGAWLASAAGGITALGLLQLTSGMTGVVLPVNLFSLSVSLVLGLPGTVALLACRLFW